jgi:hypothetical protein
MNKRAAVLAPLVLSLVAASAYADDVQTTTAGTLVVVTPSAPIVITQGAPSAPVTAPGALAAASPIPAPTPAPQNEDWNNVSHINGTVVPVGERNRYLYKFRKNEVMVDPFSAFFGYYDAAAAHAISQNVAISGSISVWDYSHGEHSGYQLTASMPIYLRRTFSGPFLEPGIVIRESSHSYDDYCYDGAADYSCGGGSTDRWAGPEMLFGWQSTFDSGLTVQWAFGVAKHVATNYSDGSDGTDVNGYFRVGYAF